MMQLRNGAIDAPTPESQSDVQGAGGVRVSVVILTFEEVPNIAECLRSCAWCDDVHVLDSGSTDRTVDIARQMGATVHVNPFRSFGQQRNWAIDHIPHRHEWVFHLDADERFTPELVQELGSVVSRHPAEAGFYVPHKLMFMGKWLRRAEGGYPVYQMRFFHRRRMRFQDWGHGQREDTTGRIGTLSEPYIHYNFSKGLEEWVEKHNRYSSLEARELHRLELAHRSAGRSSGRPSHPVERRRSFKSRVRSRIPAPWLARFLWTYLVRGGIFDGIAGFHYCLLMSNYELWIDLKLQELRAQQARAKRRSPPAATRPASTAGRSSPRVVRSSKAFTLVELLVVIGIIAVLLSILLPAVGRVRDGARSTVCASNTKQLMTAFLAFAHDHRGRLPGNFWDGTSSDPSMRSWLVHCNEPWTNAPQTGTIYRYLKDPSVYRCPSLSPESPGSGQGSNGRFDYASIPAFAGASVGQVPAQARIGYLDGRFEDIATPVIIEEDPQYSINFQHIDGCHCLSDRISSVHRGGGNYASIDGSVQWLQQDAQTTSLHWYAKGPSGNWVSLGSLDGSDGWGSWNRR
jgi:prepilin-type N-terminal cleavage/methylation domain-containing protein